MQPKKTLLSWSGGKDSAWALHTLRQDPAYRVAALLTTVNEQFNRVAIHGFREELLDLQAASVGLPLWKIPLPYPCSNEAYESRMQAVCVRAVQEGFEAVAFGDLFLEDIRAYRVAHLAGTGLEPVFPIWGIPTDRLAQTMVASGLRARITCLDPRKLSASFCGRVFDAGLSNRFACLGRSMRGARGVSQLRLCRPDVLATDRRRAHSQRRTRRICVWGPCAG